MKNEKRIICLAPDTKILLSNGVKSISDVQEGDIAISFNQELDIFCKHIIDQVRYSYHDEIVKITFSNNLSLCCTIDHPIWIFKKGWCSISPYLTKENIGLDVKQLSIGDNCNFLLDKNFTRITITGIIKLYGHFKMYVISSDTNHNFFANGILVHDEYLTDLIHKQKVADIADTELAIN